MLGKASRLFLTLAFHECMQSFILSVMQLYLYLLSKI